MQQVLYSLVLLLQDNYAPVSLPLICERDWTAEALVMSLIQPLTVEAIPQLNSLWSEYKGNPQLEYYDVESGEFVPVDNIRAHRISYPPDHIPVFRFRDGVPILSRLDEDLGGTLARGERRIGAMCSMKHMFMEYRFLWPAHLLYPREYMCARWDSIARESRAIRAPEGDESWAIVKAPL